MTHWPCRNVGRARGLLVFYLFWLGLLMSAVFYPRQQTAAPQQAQSVVSVSAASYELALAPEKIAAAFGVNLARAPAGRWTNSWRGNDDESGVPAGTRQSGTTNPVVPPGSTTG